MVFRMRRVDERLVRIERELERESRD